MAPCDPLRTQCQPPSLQCQGGSCCTPAPNSPQTPNLLFRFYPEMKLLKLSYSIVYFQGTLRFQSEPGSPAVAPAGTPPLGIHWTYSLLSLLISSSRSPSFFFPHHPALPLLSLPFLLPSNSLCSPFSHLCLPCAGDISSILSP